MIKSNYFQRVLSGGRRFLPVLLLSGGLLAACSKEDTLSDRGTPLPPGEYPLELTAGGLQAVATPAQASTRGTKDGNWWNVKSVAVSVGDEIKKYDVAASSSDDYRSATLTSNTPFWWTHSDETKTVTAWCPYSAKMPKKGDSWTISDAQTSVTMAREDFLWAYEKIPFADRETSGQLKFRHLLAKVVINLRQSDYLETHRNSVLVRIDDCLVEGIFKNSGNDLYLTEKVNGRLINVVPSKLANPPYGASASYEVLLIPQAIPQGTSQKIMQQKIKIMVGDATYVWNMAVGGGTLLGGHIYTFDITVKEHGLEVSVNETIGWDTNGASGGGSIVLPNNR